MLFKITQTNKRFGMFISLLLPLCVMTLWFVSCGKEVKPPEELTIKLFNTNDELQPDAFKQTMDRFKAKHPGLILHASTETVAADIGSADLGRKMEGADVIVFSSLIQSQLQSMPNSFYPLSVTNAVLPRVLDSAYATATPDSYWALPISLDPVLMVVKKKAMDVIPKDNMPSDWSEFTMISEWSRANKPYMVFLTGTPDSFMNGIVAYQLARGFEKYLLRNQPEDPTMTREDELGILERSFIALKRYMYENEEQIVIEIPQCSDLPTFVQSPTLATFARFSEIMALEDSQQQALYYGLTLSANLNTAPCYVTGMAVTLQSKSPSLAEEFVLDSRSSAAEITPSQGAYAAWMQKDGESGIADFPRDSIFVPVIHLKKIEQKSVIDVLNKTMSIDDFQNSWRDALYFPPFSR